MHWLLHQLRGPIRVMRILLTVPGRAARPYRPEDLDRYRDHNDPSTKYGRTL